LAEEFPWGERSIPQVSLPVAAAAYAIAVDVQIVVLNLLG
jgi:hypothetical protein